MTQDQQNTLDTFVQIKKDINSFANTVKDINSIRNYKGERISLITTAGRAFVYNATSTQAVDNVMVLDAPGKGAGRWTALYVGPVDLSWFGAKGDNTTDDSNAVQAAVNYVLKAANPQLGELPSWNGNSGTLLVPVGTYRVANIAVNGSIRMIGQGGGTYAGSTFVQASEGVSMFLLNGAQDGLSNSTVFENIVFKSGSATNNQNVAQIKTALGISSNSLYFRHCWFKTPENYAIWITQGDDLQIVGCTFDVSPFHAIKLGTQGGGMVTNATIHDNTFYQIALNHIKLDNVQGVVITNNRAYNNEGAAIPTALFINGLSATNVNGLVVSLNEYNNVPSFAMLPTNTRALVLSNNTGYRTNGYFLNLVGGGILYGASVTANTCFANSAWTNAPIMGAGCGVQGSVISTNSFYANATTPLAIDLSDSRVTGNIIDRNGLSNFTAADNLLYPHLNGQQLGPMAKAGVPTTTDVPNGTTRIVYNSADGSTKLYFNQGGALKSVSLS